jgi:hypothetical protein
MFSGTRIAGLPPGVTASSQPHIRTRSTSTASVPTIESKDTSDSQEKRRTEHHEAEIVIVGAGIVGCAAAVAFGKQGRSVLLLEKSLKEPDRIVGELLQPGGVNALEKLGMRGEHTPIARVQHHTTNTSQTASMTSTPSPATATRSTTTPNKSTSPTRTTSSPPLRPSRPKAAPSTTAASSPSCAPKRAPPPTSPSSKPPSPTS